jgi:ParB family transcriptional regulator, chromosome partitioning protein
MSRAKLVTTVTELRLDQIEVNDDRLRPVSETAVLAIAQSIKEHGLLYPLTVRRLPQGRFELVDGGHRMAALTEIGEATAPVRCYEGPASSIRMIEIDANLARADLSDLDRAIHLASRHREFLAEYPHAAQGHVGAAHRWHATGNSPLHSFATMTAAQTGMTPRKVRDYIQAGEALDKVAAEQLRSSPHRVFVNDLIAFGRADPDARPDALRAFASGEAKKLSKALKGPVKAPVNATAEAAFKALRTAWSRASKEDRKKFLQVEGKVIFDLLREIRGNDA